MLAARGARETDAGTEPVPDEAVAAALRRRARGVWARTAVAVVVSVGVLVVLRRVWDL